MNLIAMLMLAVDPSGQPLPDVVLLDFTAGYCGPCQQMAPLIQRMEQDRYPIRKIDTTEHPELLRKYNVDRIPTFIVLVNGKESRRFVGLTSDRDLRSAMNDAARKLAESAKAARRESEKGDDSFEKYAASAAESTDQKASPGGFSGLINRMKNGLTGGGSDDSANAESSADFRGQSPDGGTVPATANRAAMQSTVRVKLEDKGFSDVGTGTIVHSTAGQSTVLTCAHLFKDVTDTAQVQVELFSNGQVLRYPAKVLGGDHNSDLAFVRIQTKEALPAVKLVAAPLKLTAGERLFSIGCNAGNDPTTLSMKVVNFNLFEGPENIVCDVAPEQGRSGGGLFNHAGQLVGVCSGAFRKSSEGLYAGAGAVRKLAAELNITELTPSPSPTVFAAAPKAKEPPANPFDADELMFDEIFTESASEFEEAGFEDPAPPGPAFDESLDAAAVVSQFREELPQTTLASARSKTAVPEITVIIDSPTEGKQVIVIPKPSPWLMQLLTGQPAPNVGLTATRSRSASSEKSQQAMKPTAESRTVISGHPPVRF